MICLAKVMVNEWVWHNGVYLVHYVIDHTKDVNFDNFDVVNYPRINPFGRKTRG